MSTPRRADLAGLFAPPAESESYRQGVIQAFNPSTGANSVKVGGATLTNLPILVSGDTVNYAENDVVILMRYQSSWAILGRVVTAGSAELTAAAVDFYAGHNSNLVVFTITSALQTRSSLTVPTPSWANSALFFASSTLVVSNPSAGTDSARTSTDINGVSGGETTHQVVNDGNFYSLNTSVARQLGVGGAGPLNPTTLIETRIRTNGGTWTNGGRWTYLNAIGIFRRI